MNCYDEKIKSDLFRYTGDISYKSFFHQIIVNSGFLYTFFLRKMSKNYGKKLNILYNFWMLNKRLFTSKTHIHINHKTSIGYGLRIGYGEFVTINPDAIIGNNLSIEHGAVIGQTNRGKKEGVPTIGNNVWIGTHAVVVGKINIGDDVLIAPLTHVNFDIPSNAVVAGNPGKIISYSGTGGYVNNKWE